MTQHELTDLQKQIQQAERAHQVGALHGQRMLVDTASRLLAPLLEHEYVRARDQMDLQARRLIEQRKKNGGDEAPIEVSLPLHTADVNNAVSVALAAAQDLLVRTGVVRNVTFKKE